MTCSTLLLALQVALTAPDTAAPIGIRFTPPPAPAAAHLGLVAVPLTVTPFPVDTPRQRAFVYSDMYATRLTIHRWASWAMLPLFAAQYKVGQDLYNGAGEGSRDTHTALATGVGALFAVNTVTGGWNLWEARKDPNGRARRWIHGVAMLAADAGFLATAALAPDDDEGGGEGDRSLHRTVAISSGSLALASWVMMLVWKD